MRVMTSDIGGLEKVQAYRKVLVGYDGSDNARRALKRAIELVKQSSGELRILVVVDTISFSARSMAQFSSSVTNAMFEQAETTLAEALDMAKKAGVKAWGQVESGGPSDMILTYAAETKADLIVTGRRGMRGVMRFLMGSVSSSVMSHSDCDVLVVK